MRIEFFLILIVILLLFGNLINYFVFKTCIKQILILIIVFIFIFLLKHAKVKWLLNLRPIYFHVYFFPSVNFKNLMGFWIRLQQRGNKTAGRRWESSGNKRWRKERGITGKRRCLARGREGGRKGWIFSGNWIAGKCEVGSDKGPSGKWGSHNYCAQRCNS